MHSSSPQACDILIAHADLIVPLAGEDLPGGMVGGAGWAGRGRWASRRRTGGP